MSEKLHSRPNLSSLHWCGTAPHDYCFERLQTSTTHSWFLHRSGGLMGCTMHEYGLKYHRSMKIHSSEALECSLMLNIL